MSKKYWFPFYVADWLSSSSVACMSLEEQGAYIRLLCYDWSMDGIPDDDKKLAALSGMGEGWLKGGSHLVRVCFNQHPTKPGFLTNPRLHEERVKADVWAQKSAAGGRKSGEARRLQALKGGSHLVEPNANQKGTNNNNNNSTTLNRVVGADAPSPSAPKGARKESKPKFVKPTLDEFLSYALEIGLTSSQAEYAFDYWESKGWTVGKGNAPMKNWQAALRNWRKNEKSRTSNGTGTQNTRNAGTYETGTDHAKLVERQQQLQEAAMAGDVGASEQLAF